MQSGNNRYSLVYFKNSPNKLGLETPMFLDIIKRVFNCTFSTLLTKLVYENIKWQVREISQMSSNILDL